MIKSGLDILVESKFEKIIGANIALIINQSSVDSSLVHIIEHLASNPEIKLKKIFAPEHGLWGGPQDMEGVASSIEPVTNVPVISLYDGTPQGLAPTEEQLYGIDILVADLPDIGARYYTYAQTVAFAMAVAGKVGCKVIVLDRPNPIGGVSVEGAPLYLKYRSFCGMLTVAPRHGLTLGELALMYESGFGDEPDRYPRCRCDVEIIRCVGWRRELYLDQTGLPWVIPSPNMPSLNTAIVYPGMCLFEGTNLSEGRGTTLPFEYVGAPYIDGFKWRDRTMNESSNLLGATLRPVTFIPKFQKWANSPCGGLQLHVTDRELFRPFRWGLALVSAAKKLYPREFAWRTEMYEFVDSIPAIDLLYGSDSFRLSVDSGAKLSDLEPEIAHYEQRYSSQRESLLLY